MSLPATRDMPQNEEIHGKSRFFLRNVLAQQEFRFAVRERGYAPELQRPISCATLLISGGFLQGKKSLRKSEFKTGSQIG